MKVEALSTREGEATLSPLYSAIPTTEWALPATARLAATGVLANMNPLAATGKIGEWQDRRLAKSTAASN
jgi:hypothetical protein